MNISEIYDFQNDAIRQINAAAHKIHPKLLSRLQYHDFFDAALLDPDLVPKYKAQVLPLIEQYKKDIVVICEEYLLSFAKDMYMLFDRLGYDLDTGEELDLDDICEHLFSRNFMPCIEIQPVWDMVHSSLVSSYRPMPFWQNYSYVITTPFSRVVIDYHNVPEKYIENNRKKFSWSGGSDYVELLENNILLKRNLGYDVNIEPITASEHKQIPKNLQEAVQRHYILKHAMENIIPNNNLKTAYVACMHKDGSVIMISEDESL